MSRPVRITYMVRDFGEPAGIRIEENRLITDADRWACWNPETGRWTTMGRYGPPMKLQEVWITGTFIFEDEDGLWWLPEEDLLGMEYLDVDPAA